MCKFCQRYLHLETKSIEVDPFFEDVSGNMACIVGPNPISKRKHKKDGNISAIQVGMNSNDLLLYLPIRFCPMCGNEIKE